MRNNGNGPNGPSNNNNLGKPQLFRSLEGSGVGQSSLLGVQTNTTPVSRSHQASRTSAQFIDFFLAMYILTLQLPLTR